jgi:hypothetical protein
VDRDNAVARIQMHLGFRTDKVTEIQNALQDVQDTLERGSTLPYWLVVEDGTFTITPSMPPSALPREYALPTGFLQDIDEQDGTLRYQKSQPGPQIFLEKLDYKVAERRFYGQTTVNYDQGVVIVPSEDTQFSPGTPVAYVIRENTIRIYPGPDVTYNLLWSYYKSDAALNGSNVENGWLKNVPYLLIGHAGLLMAMAMRDADAIAVFKDMLEGTPGTDRKGAISDYLALLVEREISGRNYAMGRRL